LDVIGRYEQLTAQVENHETEAALKTLEELKGNENYDVIAGMVKEHEQSMELFMAESKILDEKIEELWTIYDPEGENSMPDETYLVKVEEILASPHLSNGYFYSDKVYQKSYFKMFIDHGQNVSNQTYQYVLLPGKTVEETKEYVNQSPIKIIENSDKVQAVEDTKNGVFAMNVWDYVKIIYY
jgi:hypothetical protein